jgi:hypothetical protein
MSLLADERVGAQEPRLRLVPPAVANLAEDAAFLASAYGLTPDPWQASILDGWLGVRSDGKWSASRAGLAVPRQNGKNGVLEVRELFGMVDQGERILHTAHEVKTARKAFLRLLEFFDNRRLFPELADLVKEIRRTNGQEAILLRNGGGVEFVARTRGSGRGFTVDVLVLDEAQELDDEAYAALLPTIASAPLGNPQQILTGTPPGPTSNGEVFTRMRESALEGGTGRLCWMEWSCEKGVDLDDPAQWARANPALGMRSNAIGLEAIADERDAMDDESFARERLGMWEVAGSVSPIDASLWASLVDPKSQPSDPVSFAVAVSTDRAFASIGVAARRPDGLRHVELVDRQRGSAWVVDRLAQLSARWKAGPVLLDASGPAGALLPELAERKIPAEPVSVREFSQACGALFDHVTESRVRHLDQLELNLAVAAAKKKPVGDAWVWRRKGTTDDISPLEAVTLAAFGADRQASKQRSGRAAFF